MAKAETTRAARVIAFIEKHCMTPDGAHVGTPMVLAKFQKDFLRDVYDNPAGTRRAILSVSRKNGKTEPPRVLRRLFSLRGLSHEQEVEPVFT